VAAEDLLGPGIAKLFEPDLAAPLRLTVDLGFGRGELLLDLAGAEPGGAFLGVEYSHKRVLKLARRLAHPAAQPPAGCATAEAIVEDRLPEGFVSAFWINFPDPWPKKRHHRRRLIQPAFVRQLARRLAPGGTLHVATDHGGYAEAIAEVLAAEPLLENLHAPAGCARRASRPLRDGVRAGVAGAGPRLSLLGHRRVSDACLLDPPRTRSPARPGTPISRTIRSRPCASASRRTASLPTAPIRSQDGCISAVSTTRLRCRIWRSTCGRVWRTRGTPARSRW
jgi:tRNA (guanine-N7-)-methyltransferase